MCEWKLWLQGIQCDVVSQAVRAASRAEEMVAADLLRRSFAVGARDRWEIMIFVIDVDLRCYGSVITAREVDLCSLLLLLLGLLWLLLRDEFLRMDLKANRRVSILFIQGYYQDNLVMSYFYVPLIV